MKYILGMSERIPASLCACTGARYEICHFHSLPLCGWGAGKPSVACRRPQIPDDAVASEPLYSELLMRIGMAEERRLDFGIGNLRRIPMRVSTAYSLGLGSPFETSQVAGALFCESTLTQQRQKCLFFKIKTLAGCPALFIKSAMAR